MTIEPTASVLILRRDPERGWVTAMVWHPRLQCWLPAGGHMEPDETAAQGGTREALEETGLDVTLVPGTAVPVPAGFPHRLIAAPGWSPRCPQPRTGIPVSHVHADHVYVATAPSPRPVREPEHHVRWFTPADIATATGISEDSRLLAAELLALAAPQPGPEFRWPQRGRAVAAARPGGTAGRTDASRTGREPSRSPRLIVVRGNPASGKFAVTAGIRDRYGRGVAAVSQDNIRRTALREHDVPGGANIGLT